MWCDDNRYRRLVQCELRVCGRDRIVVTAFTTNHIRVQQRSSRQISSAIGVCLLKILRVRKALVVAKSYVHINVFAPFRHYRQAIITDRVINAAPFLAFPRAGLRYGTARYRSLAPRPGRPITRGCPRHRSYRLSHGKTSRLCHPASAAVLLPSGALTRQMSTVQVAGDGARVG